MVYLSVNMLFRYLRKIEDLVVKAESIRGVPRLLWAVHRWRGGSLPEDIPPRQLRRQTPASVAAWGSALAAPIRAQQYFARMPLRPWESQRHWQRRVQRHERRTLRLPPDRQTFPGPAIR